MRKAGKITAGARSVARAAIADGLTTKQIDKAVNEFIVKSRAIPTFKGLSLIHISEPTRPY